ncbi:MAG: T9SS type A sorting domain-containing protein, partial [Brumimicrobium sp.]
TSTQTQNIIIDDVTAPSADDPSLPDIQAECEVTALSAPTATDNCDGTVNGAHNATLPITSNTTVTWTYEDASGNSTTQTQEVLIDDVTAPSADDPSLPDIQAECEVTALSAPTATDNCDGTVNGVHNATFPITSNTTVTWTYEDISGNTSTQTQNIIIDDVTAPSADVTSLSDIQAECEVTSLDAPTATDNCDGTITGTHNLSLPITSNTTITWIYEDASGNISTQTQELVIEDITAPSADDSTLPDIQEECEVTNLSAPTATDNCDGPTTGTHNATLPIISNTTITWTYEDASGNTSTQTQEVIISGINTNVTINEPSLVADNDNQGVTYQWINCEGNPIQEATNQTFLPDENGSYAVIVTEGNCTDTSECASITTVGLAELKNSEFSLYPNPTNGKFTVKSDYLGNDYQILDAQGRLVQKGATTSSKMQLELLDAQKGVYYLKINNTIKKIIKQ